MKCCGYLKYLLNDANFLLKTRIVINHKFYIVSVPGFSSQTSNLWMLLISLQSSNRLGNLYGGRGEGCYIFKEKVKVVFMTWRFATVTLEIAISVGDVEETSDIPDFTQWPGTTQGQCWHKVVQTMLSAPGTQASVCCVFTVGTLVRRRPNWREEEGKPHLRTAL